MKRLKLEEYFLETNQGFLYFKHPTIASREEAKTYLGKVLKSNFFEEYGSFHIGSYDLSYEDINETYIEDFADSFSSELGESESVVLQRLSKATFTHHNYLYIFNNGIVSYNRGFVVCELDKKEVKIFIQPNFPFSSSEESISYIESKGFEMITEVLL